MTPCLCLCTDEKRGMEVSLVKRNYADCIGHLEDSAGRWAWKRIDATRLAICYRNHNLRRPDTDMDDLRDSFSSLKKGIKR